MDKEQLKLSGDKSPQHVNRLYSLFTQLQTHCLCKRQRSKLEILTVDWEILVNQQYRGIYTISTIDFNNSNILKLLCFVTLVPIKFLFISCAEQFYSFLFSQLLPSCQLITSLFSRQPDTKEGMARKLQVQACNPCQKIEVQILRAFCYVHRS